MRISTCLWGLPQPPAQAAAELVALGLDWVDVDPGFKNARAASQAASRAKVGCLAAGHLLPEGARLDSPDHDEQAAALGHARRAIAEAGELGAEAAYVGAPGNDRAEIDAFARAVTALATDAAAISIRLCIEHAPGRGLDSAAATAGFVRSTGHPNLYVLIDVGHCLLVAEDAAEAVAHAGDRLGYIHFDDNDGKADLHLGLLDGILRPADVVAIVKALAASGYRGPLAIEGSVKLEAPLGAVLKSWHVLTGALRAGSE